jgi:hypothetical protein
MRAIVLVSALFAVSSFGTAALAHDGVDRDASSRGHVVREHVAREHVSREHVQRERVAVERVAVDRAARPEIKSDRVARPTEERGDRASATPTKAAAGQSSSSPVPRTVAAVAAPKVNCDASGDCATPRASSADKSHGASVSKSSSSKKEAPKVDRAASEMLKRIVLAKRCVKDDSCDGL